MVTGTQLRKRPRDAEHVDVVHDGQQRTACRPARRRLPRPRCRRSPRRPTGTTPRPTTRDRRRRPAGATRAQLRPISRCCAHRRARIRSFAPSATRSAARSSRGRGAAVTVQSQSRRRLGDGGHRGGRGRWPLLGFRRASRQLPGSLRRHRRARDHRRLGFGRCPGHCSSSTRRSCCTGRSSRCPIRSVASTAIR